jgi:hypothetical protein
LAVLTAVAMGGNSGRSCRAMVEFIVLRKR